MELYNIINISKIENSVLINPRLKTIESNNNPELIPLKLKLNTQIPLGELTPFLFNTTIDRVCKTLYLTGNLNLFLQLTRDSSFLYFTAVQLVLPSPFLHI